MTEESGTVSIEGSCAPGFEAVRDVFAVRANELGHGGGAFCAYVSGEKVVDLWGGRTRPGIAWTEDTLAVVASATKGMVTLCAQILFTHGDLDIEAPVAAYWPEFAANGKGKISVRHVLAHTSGVIGVPGHERFMRWDGTGWERYDEIVARIAASAPAWEPGTRVGYHALTYGWIMAEIMRRITGQSAGELFAREVARPLGLDAYIGTPPSEIGRVAPVVAEDHSRIPADVLSILGAWVAKVRDPATIPGQALLSTRDETFLDVDEGSLYGPHFLELEVPASNGTSTARSLARMYAVLAGGGELEGTRVVSADSIEVFGAEQSRGLEQIEVMATFTPPRALGYHRNFVIPAGLRVFGPGPDAFGHFGGGGKIGCCDPENAVAIGFVRSHSASLSKLSADLIDAVYENLS